LYVRSLQNNEV